MNRIPATTRLPQTRILPGIALLTALLAGCAATPEPINILAEHIPQPPVVYFTAPEIVQQAPRLNLECSPVPERTELAQSVTELPVAFAAGNYYTANQGDIDTLIAALPSDLSQVKRVSIMGHSRSRSHLATEHLALKRARVVAGLLLRTGIDTSLIELKADYRNNLEYVGAYPGAIVTFHMKQAGTIAPKADPTIERADTVVVPATYLLTFNAGSLRANLVRIIEEHGHTLGRWGFGDAKTEVDWIIEKGFSYTVDADLQTILDSINGLYGIQGHINPLDKTVDFEKGAIHE